MTREERIEAKLDRLVQDLAELRERFPTRDELIEVSRDGRRRSRDIATVTTRIAVVESTQGKLWAALAAVGATVLGTAATLLTRLL